jgi:hypothetical protein
MKQLNAPRVKHTGIDILEELFFWIKKTFFLMDQFFFGSTFFFWMKLLKKTPTVLKSHPQYIF